MGKRRTRYCRSSSEHNSRGKNKTEIKRKKNRVRCGRGKNSIVKNKRERERGRVGHKGNGGRRGGSWAIIKHRMKSSEKGTKYMC